MAILIPKFAGEEIDPERRRAVVTALRLGLLGAGAGALGVEAARAAPLIRGIPERMPEGRSVYRMQGEVTVNDSPASESTIIRPGDTVATGTASQIVFVVEDNAHILRANSRISLPKQEEAVRTLRVLTGVLLSVFGKRKQRIAARNVTIGIRGTGVYVESSPDESYVCTCYGTADLIPENMTEPEETVVTTHHDAPRYATRTETGGKRIRSAPFKNHTDLEVAAIEALVGRVPPFAFTLDRFDSPINSY